MVPIANGCLHIRSRRNARTHRINPLRGALPNDCIRCERNIRGPRANIGCRRHVRRPVSLLARLNRKLTQIAPVRGLNDRRQNHDRVVVKADHPLICSPHCQHREQKEHEQPDLHLNHSRYKCAQRKSIFPRGDKATSSSPSCWR